MDQIRSTHKDQVQDLRNQIKNLKQEVELMTKQAKSWEEQHKKLSNEKEFSEKMLSACE